LLEFAGAAASVVESPTDYEPGGISAAACSTNLWHLSNTLIDKMKKGGAAGLPIARRSAGGVGTALAQDIPEHTENRCV